MATQRQPEPESVPEMTPAEMWARFDRIARRAGLSVDEFVRRYDAHEIDVDDPEHHSDYISLAMMLPRLRRVRRGR